MANALIDNDVLIKAAAFALLLEILERCGGEGSVGILGAARYVVGSRLARHPALNDRNSAIQRWTAFLVAAEELEPTPAELDLATSIEEAAIRAGASLDSGESQLCSMAIHRQIRRVMTGDKRAIAALNEALGSLPRLSWLTSRMVCLEQIIVALSASLGLGEVRRRVCDEPGIDKSVSACLGCWGPGSISGEPVTGLLSYIDDIRRHAPTMLVEGNAFP